MTLLESPYKDVHKIPLTIWGPVVLAPLFPPLRPTLHPFERSNYNTNSGPLFKRGSTGLWVLKKQAEGTSDPADIQSHELLRGEDGLLRPGP